MKPFSRVLVLISAITIFSTFPCFAASVQITPILFLEQAYTDNILFSEDEKQSDHMTTVAGEMRLENKDARLNTRAGIRLEKIIYWEYDEYNSADHLLYAGADYRLTERLSAGIDGQYLTDSQFDRSIDSTGLVTTGEKEAWDLDAHASYRFSPRLTGHFSTGFQEKEIDHPLYRETLHIISAHVGVSKDISAVLKNTRILFGSRYLAQDSENCETDEVGMLINQQDTDYDSEVFQVYTGFSKKLSERVDLTCQAGVNFSDTCEKSRYYIRSADTGDILISGPENRYHDSTMGGMLYGALTFHGETSVTDLSFSHDIRQGTGTNGTVERTSAVFNLVRYLDESLSVSFKTSCHLNRNERQSAPDLDELTLNIQPGLTYEIKPGLSVQATARISYVDDRVDHVSRKKRLVYVEIRQAFDGIQP